MISTTIFEIPMGGRTEEYIRSIGDNPSEYASYRVTTYGDDGRAQSGKTSHAIYHVASGRGACEAGGDWCWTDASSPDDVVDRYFGIDGKEVRS